MKVLNAVLAGVAAGVTLAAAGCAARGDSGGGSPRAAGSGTPTGGTSATIATTGVATHRRAACRAADVRATLSDPESAKFENDVTLVVTNTSGRSCVLAAGVPGLRLRDADGHPMPTTVVPDGSRQPGMTLAPGAAAKSLLTWHKYVDQGRECPPFPASVDVSLPGDRTATRVPWVSERDGGSVCDGGRVQARYFTASR